MKVKEIMTKGVEFASPWLTIREAAQLMLKHNVGVLPVWDGQLLRGAITDRDIVLRAVAQGGDPNKVAIHEVMTRSPVFCYEDQELADAAKILEKKKIRRIPVMSRGHELVGMLSLADFTRKQEGQRIVSEVLEAVGARHV